MSLEKLKMRIIGNDFELPKEVREKAIWHAATTNFTSGIFSFPGTKKIYFNIIKPWYGLPDGRVELEYCNDHS